MHHAVGKGVAHRDVDLVGTHLFWQRAQGRHQQALVGQHKGGAGSRTAGEYMTGELALHDVFGAFDEMYLARSLGENRLCRRLQLGKMFLVPAEKEACLLLVGEVVGIVIGQQVSDAKMLVVADNESFAFAHGVEADEIDSLPAVRGGQGRDMLGHVAIGHAVVGLVLL